jgi:hypothetical protein
LECPEHRGSSEYLLFWECAARYVVAYPVWLVGPVVEDEMHTKGWTRPIEMYLMLQLVGLRMKQKEEVRRR